MKMGRIMVVKYRRNWVSGLEKIVAELKAERFGPKRPVIASE